MIPDDVWSARQVNGMSTFAVGWDTEPASKSSIDHGAAWLRKAGSPLLVVPSVIVPEETNVLIIPKHPLAARIKATKVRK